MAKRKSITGIKKKKPANKVDPRKLPTPNTSSEASEERNRSITLSPDVVPGKRTLLSTKNSRRAAQQGRVNKSAHRKQPKASFKATLKHVPQATVQSKWKVLDTRAQAKVESLFRSVSLPVLAKHAKQAGKVEAQDAISLITRSLCKRLPKMSFPQTTKEGHFDYDGLVKNNRDLQQRLVTAVDLVTSSKAELEKRKIELRSERRELQRLEAILEDYDHRSVFLPALDKTVEYGDMPDAIGLVGVSAG